jgi:hypothetical protein
LFCFFVQSVNEMLEFFEKNLKKNEILPDGFLKRRLFNSIKMAFEIFVEMIISKGWRWNFIDNYIEILMKPKITKKQEMHLRKLNVFFDLETVFE